jgi:hypothetical protein
MTIPEPFLPPPSQPWGRWASSAIQRIDRALSRFELDVNNNLRQLNITQRQPMRGLLSRQTSTTVTISTAGVYVPINAVGTLDADVSFNMAASGAPNVSGLKNTTNQTRTMVIIATYDGRGGNNQAIGLKLALNGVPIDGSECRSFAGSSGQFGKAMSQWMLKLEPGDEITMLAANIDTTTNLTIQRYKMLAHPVQ